MYCKDSIKFLIDVYLSYFFIVFAGKIYFYVKKEFAELGKLFSCLTWIRTKTGRTKNCSATITP